MPKKIILILLFILFTPMISSLFAETDSSKKKSGVSPADTAGNIEVTARVLAIPNKMPPNDLYNYVFIIKYRVISVEKGELKEREILVGQYNPLIPRDQIKDKMDKYVSGNVTKFSEGQIHKLVLTSPLDSIWTDAVEDEYEDEDEPVRYFALKTDLAK